MINSKGLIATIFMSMGFAGAISTATSAETLLRVLSDRTPSHLEPLFEQYEQGAGVEIEAVFVDDGLLARLKARPTEADVVITSTADILEAAEAEGLLAPLPDSVLAEVDPSFRHPDNVYVISSYRARALYVSRDRVEPGEISSYQDLAAPEWQGRVCIRSGYHRYNVSLFAQMAADRGLEWTREFLTGLKKNLARAPSGNDRAQVQAVYEGVCDVSVGNSYYMPIMLGRDDQRAWAEATRVIFPDQGGDGSYVMTGGIALTKAGRVEDAAAEFVGFMLSDYGQEFVANLTYEYPVIDGVELPELLTEVGADQTDRTEAPFHANVIPLAKIEAMREEVIRILDEIDFDNP